MAAATYWLTGTSAPCLSLFKPFSFDGFRFGAAPQLLSALGPEPGAQDDGGRSLWWQGERLHRAVLRDYPARSAAFLPELARLQGEFVRRTAETRANGQPQAHPSRRPRGRGTPCCNRVERRVDSRACRATCTGYPSINAPGDLRTAPPDCLLFEPACRKAPARLRTHVRAVYNAVNQHIRSHSLSSVSTSAASEQAAAPSLLLPYLALVAGVLCISFTAIFTKWAAVPGPVAAAWRMLVATAVLAIPFAREARRWTDKERAGLKWGVMGGLWFAVNLALLNSALLLTSAANATLLDNTAPIWVGLGALVSLQGETARPLLDRPGAGAGRRSRRHRLQPGCRDPPSARRRAGVHRRPLLRGLPAEHAACPPQPERPFLCMDHCRHGRRGPVRDQPRHAACP